MKLNSIVQQAGTYQLKPVVKQADQATQTQLESPKRESTIRNSEQGVALAQQFQQQQRSTIYDQPNFKSSKAIGEYLAIATESRREELKSMIGVSVYA
ncbi:hypothetical protein ACSLBF_20175 (plasmid) [Pseudoalteromonas sp. T1lg65]|uniref:hypothetical protein n=1 Tax=Pseudoalteromonas sp. T1lg65 TaxID=2077101 RepID=UPI003F791C94